MGLRCKDWGDLSKAKVLLIGHDPRLQKSDTIAEYCFFADYYFKQVSKKQDKRKQGLINEGPYFEPKKTGTFKKVCGNIYDIYNHNAKLIPVLHPKQYPLNSIMKNHYYEHYESIKRFFKDI